MSLMQSYITRMLQTKRCTMLLYQDCISLLEQSCDKSDNINKVVTCCKLVDNLGQAERTQVNICRQKKASFLINATSFTVFMCILHIN